MWSTLYDCLTDNNVCKAIKSLWKSSKYFRIISIATTSLTGIVVSRNLYLKCWRQYNNLPSGTFGLPLIGDALNVLNLDWYFNGIGKYENVASFCLGPMNVIAINNPYLVKQIYADSRTHDVPDYIFGELDAFSNKNGQQWQKRRHIIVSNIRSTMKSLFIEKATKRFIQNKVFPVIDDKISKHQKIDTKQLFRPLGFNLVLTGFLGKELVSLQDPFWISNDKLMRRMVNDRKYQRILSILFNDSVTRKIMNKFGLHHFTSTFDTISHSIQEYAINGCNNLQVNNNDSDVKLFNDYLNQMKQNKFTQKQLCNDFGMLLFAAIDTSYSALTSALLLAAKYPSIQQELFEELVTAFGHNVNNISLSSDNLLKIPKLRAFIYENIRINSPAPLSGFRKINEKGLKIDTTEFGGKRVYDAPKGTHIIINVWNIHHTAKWWVKHYDAINNENMNQIHFEFWIDHKGKFSKKPNIDLIGTFSKGKRNCLGQFLAKNQLMMVLSMIFMKYKIYGPNGTADFEMEYKFTNSLQPKIDSLTLELR